MTWVLRSRSLHYLSKVRTVSVSIEESDCVFQPRRAQVHIHLGRRQVLVAGQLLDRLRRRPAHRQECLNAHWFTNFRDVRTTIEAWRQEYNGQRPHSALGGLSPQEFLRAQTTGSSTESVENLTL
jgi:hypothetical protein